MKREGSFTFPEYVTVIQSTVLFKIQQYLSNYNKLYSPFFTFNLNKRNKPVYSRPHPSEIVIKGDVIYANINMLILIYTCLFSTTCNCQEI